MEYTTVQKTAQKWGVTVAFVYLAAKAGRIPGAKQEDGKWQIPVDAENPAKKPPPPKRGYLTPAAAAEKWGTTVSFVYLATKTGRIPGAEQIGGRWHIPENAENPAKIVKTGQETYLSTAAAAEKWGITQSAVGVAAKAGRIPGAKQVGGRWQIPENAESPARNTRHPKAGYLFVTEAAEKWGETASFVYDAAKEGRISGARQVNGRWYIPENAENPAKNSREETAGYLTTAAAAEKWGITQGAVGVAAKAGRIPGAKQVKGIWYIPETVEAPLNERTTRLPGHMSVAKAAEKWGVSQRAVHKAAKEGQISGAKQVSGKWNIPEDALCPIVGYKKGKKVHK